LNQSAHRNKPLSEAIKDISIITWPEKPARSELGGIWEKSFENTGKNLSEKSKKNSPKVGYFTN